MAKKKEIKDAVVSETKEKKKKEDKIEEVVEEVEETEKEVKKEKNKKEKKTKKDSFLKSVRKEMKEVVWPSSKDVLKSTIAVIIICIILCLFFEGIELLMAFIKGLFQ